MDELKQITDRLEYMLLKKIIEGLESDAMTIDETRQYASDFLDLEPFQSIEDTETKIHSFVAKYPVFTGLNEYVDAYHEEQRKDSLIEQMKAHLKNKDIDQAIQVVKPS